MGFQGTFCTFLNLEARGDCSSHYLGKRYINYPFPFVFHEKKTQMGLEKLEGEKIMTDLFCVFLFFGWTNSTQWSGSARLCNKRKVIRKREIQGETLTLQALILFLHADEQNLLVDGFLPQGPVVSWAAPALLSTKALLWGEGAGLRVLILFQSPRRKWQQLPAIHVLWKTADADQNV